MTCKDIRAVLMAVLLFLPVAALVPARAQEATEVPASAAAPDDGLMTPGELDTLMAPVALFPDALLAQVMMATTFPLDVVRAGRFVADTGDLSDADRAAAAEKRGWDPSVFALTAGFPSLVTRMSDHIDWTEQVGDAVLVQTGDVLDSVQRLRAEAAANGYLESNPAQTVTINNEIITIAPANPEVVHVPAYDPRVVYTTTAPSVPYVINNGNNLNDALATGAIVFGTAILLDTIFNNNNNNNNWNGYWGGSRPINWNNRDFYPRPGIGIGGDVNIDRGDININNGRVTNIDRNNLRTERITDIDRSRVNADRSRVTIDGQRPGNLDRDQLDRARDGGFTPATADRDAARAQIEARRARGEGVASLPAPGTRGDRPPQRAANADLPQVNRGAARAPSASNLPSVNRPSSLAAQPAATRPQVNRSAARSASAGNLSSVNRPANVSRPSEARRPAASRPSPGSGAFQPSGGSRAAAAANRGRASGGGLRRN